MSHPIPHRSLKQSCQKLFSLKPFNVLVGGEGQGWDAFFFVCLLFADFFWKRGENIKNTEERKSFPDNTAEQVNSMADILSMKIKEMLKQKTLFYAFIL